MATYGSIEGVERLVPEIAPIDGTTTPNDDQVAAWLLEAYSKINRAIGDAGYSAPVNVSAALYPELTGLENLYAAAYTLRARGIDVSSGEGENRSEVWLKEFYAQLKSLTTSNLALLGVSLLVTGTATRRRIRTLQMRKVDGYSAGARTFVTDDQSYAQAVLAASQGEYTPSTAPSE